MHYKFPLIHKPYGFLTFLKSLQQKDKKLMVKFITFKISRLTSSESQGQEEAACARPANATTGVLFTATNAIKFPSTVTRSSWALPLNYYRGSTFLP